MQEQIKALLDEVTITIGILRKANELFSDRLAPDFNMFEYLRTDEIGLSRCIESLLNPTGKHGQGSVFLKGFFKHLDRALPENLNFNWAAIDTDGCQVNLEKQANGQRRIDVYLRFKSGEIIGIENKPWAVDQKDQLIDYADFIENNTINNKKWLLIYLSNIDPSNSDYSIKKIKREAFEKSGNFVWIDYEGLVEWLEFCASKAKALVVRVFIEELIKFIRIEVNGDLDMSEEKEIENVILASPNNLKSAFHIFKVLEGVKKDLLNKFQVELIANLEQHSLKLDWHLNKWTANRGFNIQFGETKQNLTLRFEFAGTSLNGFFWGISRQDKDYKNQLIWTEVNKLMSVNFGSTSFSPHWPWYSELPDAEFDKEMNNWLISEKPWLSIMDGSLVDEITDLAIRVRDAFGNNLNLLSEGGRTQ